MFIEQYLFTLNQLADNHPLLTILGLIFSKVLFAIFMLPASVLTLVDGILFGVFYGSIISVAGNIVAACVGFLVSRYLFRSYVQHKILKKYPKLNEYEDKLFKDGLLTVVFLRLVPIFPFNILNYFLGVTEVKFRDYMIGTTLGIIPGTIAYVYLGESIMMHSLYQFLFAFSIVVLLIYIGNKIKV